MLTRRPIRLKTPTEMDAMAVAGAAARAALAALAEAAQPDASLLDLEALAIETLRQHGARPALLGYHPGFSAVVYQHATCLSVNDEVIHGVPRPRKLREGDVLGIDLVAEIEGWHADTAITVGVGEITPRAQKLLRVTEESMMKGIEVCVPGNTVGDIGHAIQRHVERNGFSILKNMVGHGVGTAVHEPGLDIANTGRPKSGVRLEPGMTFCVEPMVTAGRGDNKHRRDDPWAVVTKDGSIGAHFEHTVGVTDDGFRILT
ncbi:MAG: type I methionyl aminopeptidase [Fimbriimonadaceae bacterium]|nr:type I methionyl aminopeptidase [Fimbriimonadaceae bacterium]